ncbi:MULTISPECIES: nucleotide exchange factor GrpE [Kocuria]|uniref:nucleotide exchange factor GrpE n=1 Tax=Kocuria TaxID=57493 RepID=UPI0009E83479|nr:MULTISPECIES: nucleotide exchange factor GrpE [Kocuria]WIW69318.1 nucleotide exchange factor GrpE [Kocuria sp. ChxB]MBO4144629.1 nucleotide exchange factor GrpE [Kocuria rhizophila]MCT1545088.1 nucleotide exchange factor GrpE [Kocuria rhizophila]MCT2170614.1 nucleotide exchange factor GrpE [Kocuria rhizophila]MDN3462030.1 nucleotide exchange factor GrpE [Kocuria sp. APC 4018]
MSMSDSENTEGHGQSVPEDPEQPAQHQQDASQNGGLTVDDILDTPQSQDAESADAASSTGDAAPEGDSEAQRLADERLEDLRRLQAEFVNYKNRTVREKDQLRDFVSGELVSALLPVLDDIDAARKAGDLEDGPFAAIATKLEDALGKKGLTRIGEVGESFDPNVHEAVMQQPTDEVEPDHVSMVLRSGFKVGNRVVRAAQVAVAAQP